jgi:hypothetical protein
MFIDSKLTPSTTVRRSGRQLDFLPVGNHSAPSNGKTEIVAPRPINISPLWGETSMH